MKVYLHKNLPERIKEITGKRLQNMTIYYDDMFVADKDNSIDIGEGTYNVKLEIEYTNGTIDVLTDEELYVSHKDINVTVNYRNFSDVIRALMTSPLFWLGIALSFIGIGFLIIIFVFYFSEKSRYYQKKGCKIFTLRYR